MSLKLAVEPKTANISEVKSCYQPHKVSEFQPLKAVNQSLKKSYSFLTRCKNPNYESSIKILPLRTCLIRNNVTAFSVRTEPKWLTDLLCAEYDSNTGDVGAMSVYSTNDIKQSNNRKIKALDRFCNHFQPLYRQKSVSLLFYTLTIANQANMDIRNVLHVLRKRFKRKGIRLHGYIWTSEVSDDLHWHYHVCVSIDRLNVIKMPDYLKLDNVWGARCQVAFVKKNVRHYMAKYFAKHNYRIEGIRSYGMSKIKK